MSQKVTIVNAAARGLARAGGAIVCVVRCDKGCMPRRRRRSLVLRHAVDVWAFQTADGRSLRRAVDWLLPYATGAAPWPYAPPQAPSWIGFWEPLRLASIAYRSEAYERAGCEVMKRAAPVAGNTREYQTSLMNLQHPPLYQVTC